MGCTPCQGLISLALGFDMRRNIMKPNNNFDFNVEELALVEDAMRYRLRRLTSRRATVVKESSKVKIDAEVTQISSLLGKIHNQKIFYSPKAGFVGGG
jgi:hypothetical protein